MAGRSIPNNTEGRTMEGRISELAIHLRDEVDHSLRSTKKCRSMFCILKCSPTARMWQFLRGLIHGLLNGSFGMDCGDELLHDAKVVIYDSGHMIQILGGVGGIADNFDGVRFLMFHIYHKPGSSIESRDGRTLASPFK